MATAVLANYPKPDVYTSSARGYRQSAQKARLVMDLIRGKTVGEALNILRFTHNRAARPIEKVIRSAAANAVHAANRENKTVDELALVVCDGRVDQGMAVSRWRPRSRGMANPYTRYYCHIAIGVVAAEDLEDLKRWRQVNRQKKTRIAREALASKPARGRSAAASSQTEDTTEEKGGEAGE